MRHIYLFALSAALIWGPLAYGSVSETEPNDVVAGSALFKDGEDSYVTLDIDNTGAAVNPEAPPAAPTPLPLTDEIVGQLGSTRDYDWYYIDVTDNKRPVTPIYFGCDKKLGFYREGPEDFAPNDEDVSYQINYYYRDPNTLSVTRQSSYIVGRESCKRGEGETKGPFRFQMNTTHPGRYYVRIWGHKFGVKEVKDPDTKIKYYYDEIAARSGDYTLRVYTTRNSLELEPNDGMTESFALNPNETVASQLSSMYDQDWFFIDNGRLPKPAKANAIYFTCLQQGGATSGYYLSSYNAQGVLQSSYEVTPNQCAIEGGFKFEINTPVNGIYYVVVSPPTYAISNELTFTQSDFTIRWFPPGYDDNQTGGTDNTPTRKDGDLEPNDRQVDAYPIPADQSVTSQLSTVSDQDWFSINKNAGQDLTKPTTIFFKCSEPENSTASFLLSALNPQGILQNSYTVSASQCRGSTGFEFKINTPTPGTYYVKVAAPPGVDATTLSQSDFTISTVAPSDDSSGNSVTGTLKKAAIFDDVRNKKDKFEILLNNCGNSGSIKLTGKKLNLSGVDQEAQVKVQIGNWSCLSDPRELSVNVKSNKTIYAFPEGFRPTPATPTTGGSGQGNSSGTTGIGAVSSGTQ
jgi:hypothetical protein